MKQYRIIESKIAHTLEEATITNYQEKFKTAKELLEDNIDIFSPIEFSWVKEQIYSWKDSYDLIEMKVKRIYE